MPRSCRGCAVQFHLFRRCHACRCCALVRPARICLAPPPRHAACRGTHTPSLRAARWRRRSAPRAARCVAHTPMRIHSLSPAVPARCAGFLPCLCARAAVHWRAGVHPVPQRLRVQRVRPALHACPYGGGGCATPGQARTLPVGRVPLPGPGKSAQQGRSIRC